MVAIAGLSGVYGFSEKDGFIERLQAQVTGQCVIKGNISTSGERIYHLPGQRYYSGTFIAPRDGEVLVLQRSRGPSSRLAAFEGLT